MANYTKKKEYKNLQKIKKEDYKKKIIDQLKITRDSSAFWKIINNFRYRTQGADLISLEEWYNFFQLSFPPSINNSKTLSVNGNAQLEMEITLTEID